MMTQVCCICDEVYGHKPGPDEVTHGHCDGCHPRVMAGEHFNAIRKDRGLPPKGERCAW